MSKIIKLPSGNTVTLRDPKSMKQKDRKKIYVDGEVTISTGLAMMENIMAMLIEEWTFDLLIPSVKVDSLGELDIDDYDALNDHAQEALVLLFPRLNKTEESEADPKALGGNSND
jgi:NAD-specific glutamate dehydrogenase